MKDAFDEFCNMFEFKVLPEPLGRCRCYIEPILKESDTMNEGYDEPEYYNSNGLSPIGAFKRGLISRDELIGFYKGNIIKYVVRAGKKESAVEDLLKAKSYINFYLELFTMDTKEISELEQDNEDIARQLSMYAPKNTIEENHALLKDALEGLKDETMKGE